LSGRAFRVPHYAFHLPYSIFRVSSAPLPNSLLIDTVRGVNQRFFEITSREEKIAYIPLSQLLRIESKPRGGIFLNFTENFQVNIEIADGAESAAVRSLYDELVSGSTEPIRLNPETLNITHIHF
jgi:hypothetical protein